MITGIRALGRSHFPWIYAEASIISFDWFYVTLDMKLTALSKAVVRAIVMRVRDNVVLHVPEAVDHSANLHPGKTML